MSNTIVCIFLWVFLVRGIELESLLHFFHPDGKYCLIETNHHYHSRSNRQHCHVPITIHTRYPYLIVSLSNHPEEHDRIHVVRPSSWPHPYDHHYQWLSMEFNIPNLTYHPWFHTANVTFTLNNKYSLHTQLQSDYIDHADHVITFERIVSHSFENMTKHHLCDIQRNLLPGRWKYDPDFKTTEENKLQNCPDYRHRKHRKSYSCPQAYSAPQYFPDANCFILPVRLSLALLHHLQASSLPGLMNFASFIGDSLVGQLYESGRCEIESNRFNDSLDVEADFKPFIRSDLPCESDCITNRTFLSTHSTWMNLCWGCREGVKILGKPIDHPQVYGYLNDVNPLSRIVVIDAGAWFTTQSDLYQESLEGLLPQLAKLNKNRGYALDFYFLELPGIDVSLSRDPNHGWHNYQNLRRIAKELLSQKATAPYNLKNRSRFNHKLISRKGLIDNHSNVFMPDSLHYCDLGTFSATAFLFELILHQHTRKLLKQNGLQID